MLQEDPLNSLQVASILDKIEHIAVQLEEIIYFANYSRHAFTIRKLPHFTAKLSTEPRVNK